MSYVWIYEEDGGIKCRFFNLADFLHFQVAVDSSTETDGYSTISLHRRVKCSIKRRVAGKKNLRSCETL